MKKTIIIIILSLLLVGTFGYFGYNEYLEYKQNKEIKLVQFGYEQAIIQLMQLASKCEQIPVTYNNYTLNLLAVECLQQNEK